MLNRKDILDFISANKGMFRAEFDITKIGVFGSIARNEQTESSDIDLILEFDPKVQNIHAKKMKLRRLFEVEFNVSVDICREKCIKPVYREVILHEAIYV